MIHPNRATFSNCAESAARKKTKFQSSASVSGGLLLRAKHPKLHTAVAACLLLLVTVAVHGDGTGSASEPTKENLKLFRKRDGNLLRFFVENLAAGNLTVTFNPSMWNLKSKTPFPHTSTVSPHQVVEAFVLSPIDEKQAWNYTLTNYFTLGSNCAIHDDSVVYQLPYEPGKTFRVSQAYGGTFSHTGPEHYAVDWMMPEGTEVFAARPGVVVSTQDQFDAGGPDRRFEAKVNQVLVEHSDGTVGNYAHLMKKGIVVQVGQRVQVGDLLGYSGNSGFSSGPHLHFCVFKTKDGQERESVPVRFSTSLGDVTLKCGQSYSSAAASMVAERKDTLNAR